MDQQNQTLKFFQGHAKDWNSKATSNEYNVINDRHRAVHSTLAKKSKHQKLLDVGCGTGQLAIEASQLGHDAIGIDFAPEMIEICQRNNSKAGATASFDVASVFEFNPDTSFDVISAMGFIEYISSEQLGLFLDKAHSWLNGDGYISIGSRNRLFNVVSFNDYTEMELEGNTTSALIREARILREFQNKGELFNELLHLSNKHHLPEISRHPRTNIGVDTRHQFTPATLIALFQKHGFKVSDIYPVNYHLTNLTSGVNNDIILLRKSVAELISQEHQSEIALIPNCTSFVIEATRNG